jgi:hypothetical protein
MFDEEFSDGEGICLQFNCYFGRVLFHRLGPPAEDASFDNGSAAQEQRWPGKAHCAKDKCVYQEWD